LKFFCCNNSKSFSLRAARSAVDSGRHSGREELGQQLFSEKKTKATPKRASTVDMYNWLSCPKLNHDNILVMVAAGTGKSTLLKFVSEFGRENRYEPVILALSGVVAVNVKGATIHRWFSISRMSKGSFLLVIHTQFGND